MMKKYIVASVIFLLGSFQVLGAAAADVPTSVQFLEDAHVVQGDNSTGDLRLSDPINRAEFMKIVSEAVRESVPDDKSYANCLPDIHDEWFAKYVCWAESKGYISGYPDGTFKAGNDVTHAEALKIIHEMLHIDYSRYLPVVNKDLWYDKYLKSALGTRIVGEDVESKLAEPITRGEAFEYLYRAMAITDRDSFVYATSLDTPYREWYDRFANETRSLTPGEEKVLQVIGAMADYGFSPKSSSGTSMVEFTMTNNDYPGQKIHVRGDLQTTEHITGSGATLDASQMTVDLALDINGNLGGSDFTLKGKMAGEVMLGGGKLYLNPTKVEIVDVALPLVQKVAISQMVDGIQDYLNTWYYIDLPEPLRDQVSQDLNHSVTDAIRTFLEHTSGPIWNISMDTEGDQESLLIKINPEYFIEYTQKLMATMDKGTNIYEVRNDLRKAMPQLETLFSHMSYLVTYLSNDYRLREGHFVVEPTSLQNLDGINLDFETFSNTSSDYPSAVEITLPQEFKPMDELLNALSVNGGQAL